MKRPLRHCSLLRVWFSHRSSRSRPRERGVGKQRTRLPAAPTAGSWKSSSAWRRRRSGWTRSSASMRAISSPRHRESPRFSAATRPRPSPRTTRTRASCRLALARSAGVASTDASSTQTTSSGGASRCASTPASASGTVAEASLTGSSTLISTGCGYIARPVRASRFLTAPLRAVQQQEERLPAKAAVHQARDLQLQISWLRGRDAALLQARKRKLRTAEGALDRALRQWNSRTVPALLQASEDARQPAPRKLSKMLRKRLQRLEERLEAARKRPTPKTLHRARISVKQVRYLLQVAKEALPKKAHRLDADLKSLQASLGELHDADVRIALIKHRPKLLRAEREARERLAKVVDAQLSRWHGQKVAAHTQELL